MKQYYVTHNGEQLGPFAETHIEEKVAADELSATDLCWTEGMEGWEPIQEVIQLDLPPTEVATPPIPSQSDQELTQKTLWQKISSWPGAIYFSGSMILLCLLIPSVHPQVGEKASWVVEALLYVVQMAALILAIQAIISARKKSPLAGAKKYLLASP